jgi:CRISPR-associated protein Csb2
LLRFYRAGWRPGPGDSVLSQAGTEEHLIASIFSDRWLVLEHVSGEMPDLRAAASVAKALHKAVMAGYERIGLGGSIPAEISGHAPDGTPLDKPHLGFVPMAFLGSRYADGAVYGFALVPPRSGNLLAQPTFQRAMRAIMTWEADGRRGLAVTGDGLCLAFAPAGEIARQSLDPAPYIGEANTWATCTPVLLDRHLKEKGNDAREVEIQNLVRRACANIGLPEPSRVAPDKHSAVEGATSAYPSGRAPAWTGWRLPTSLASRQLTHAVLQFENPVRGPVILGAGRFVGLGLCRALDPAGSRA